MTILTKWLLLIEAYAHNVDAYLARYRGDREDEAYSKCRALECERKLILLDLNREELSRDR